MSKRFLYDEFSEDIFDDEIQQYPSNQTICNILNQQQQRIAELENLLSVERVVKAEKSKQLEKATHDRNRYKNKIAELEEQLKNAIVPKFKVGQEIWEIAPLMSWKIKRIEWNKFNGGNGNVVVEIYRLGHDGTADYNCCIMPVDNDRFFATKEEAQAKLEELKRK